MRPRKDRLDELACALSGEGAWVYPRPCPLCPTGRLHVFDSDVGTGGHTERHRYASYYCPSCGGMVEIDYEPDDEAPGALRPVRVHFYD